MYVMRIELRGQGATLCCRIEAACYCIMTL